MLVLTCFAIAQSAQPHFGNIVKTWFPYAFEVNFNKFIVSKKSKFVLIVTALCLRFVSRKNKS